MARKPAAADGVRLTELLAALSLGTDLGMGHPMEHVLRQSFQLTNLTFETCDAASFDVTEPFDAILVFNAIHDQVVPAAVLRRIREALRPGGTFLMNEPRLAGNLEDDLTNPMAPFVYAVSTVHCLTVSLAGGGAGLGTGWGEPAALRMLADAGFTEVAVHDAPGDPGNAVYVAHKPPG